MSFCERHCIGLHNYNYWWAKYREEKGLSRLSKNKGRKKVKSTSTALENKREELPTTVSSLSSHETGGFIKIEGYAPHQTGRLALRTPQGVELSFEGLPPVSYLQQLLNLVQQP